MSFSLIRAYKSHLLSSVHSSQPVPTLHYKNTEGGAVSGDRWLDSPTRKLFPKRQHYAGAAAAISEKPGKKMLVFHFNGRLSPFPSSAGCCHLVAKSVRCSDIVSRLDVIDGDRILLLRLQISVCNLIYSSAEWNPMPQSPLHFIHQLIIPHTNPLMYFVRLQEVETEQYYTLFLETLKERGYDGYFCPKSRAKLVSEQERKHVDGCAVFFKTEKWVKELLFTSCTQHDLSNMSHICTNMETVNWDNWETFRDEQLDTSCRSVLQSMGQMWAAVWQTCQRVSECVSAGLLWCRNTPWSSTRWPWPTPRARRSCWIEWWPKTTSEWPFCSRSTRTCSPAVRTVTLSAISTYMSQSGCFSPKQDFHSEIHL